MNRKIRSIGMGMLVGVMAGMPNLRSQANHSFTTALATTSPHNFVMADNGHQLLEQVSQLYKKMPAIEATFLFEYFQNSADKVGQAEEGKIWLNQSNKKYRISTSAQELISDGKTQWAVLKDANEIQVTDAGLDESGITPLNVFSFFNKGFGVKTLAAEKLGTINLDVLELTPENRRENYSKIIIRLNKANKHIVDVTVFDKNNSRYRYTIKQLKSSENLPDSRFVFNTNEFPGMEIVDLR